jgi:uncharacterized membrane protein YecN with MAPEG domain
MITALYASILAFIFIYLTMMVIRSRQNEGVALGSGSSKTLEQRIGAHSNFAEYTPIFLILLFAAEYQDMPNRLIHVAGIIYVVGRILHAYGVVCCEKYKGGKLLTNITHRKYGMVCTVSTIGILAIINFVVYVRWSLLGVYIANAIALSNA